MKTTKRELDLLSMSLGLALIILGATMNFIAITSNDCLMPVSNSAEADFSTKHINYYFSYEVKHFYLTDVIGWENNKCSIGDIFIVVGISSVIGFMIRYIIQLIKQSKEVLGE